MNFFVDVSFSDIADAPVKEVGEIYIKFLNHLDQTGVDFISVFLRKDEKYYETSAHFRTNEFNFSNFRVNKISVLF